MSKAVEDMPAWRGPSALDLLADFVKRYGAIIYRADEESGRRDATVYFEPELRRLIRAFVDESAGPIIEMYKSILELNLPPSIPVPATKGPTASAAAYKEELIHMRLDDDVFGFSHERQVKTIQEWLLNNAPSSSPAPIPAAPSAPAQRLPGDSDPLA